MSPVAEAIQSALAQHRIIKDRHPFFNAAVGSENRRAARVPFDQQIIEVGSSLAGKLLKSETVYDEKIGSDKWPLYVLDEVIVAPCARSSQFIRASGL